MPPCAGARTGSGGVSPMVRWRGVALVAAVVPALLVRPAVAQTGLSGGAPAAVDQIEQALRMQDLEKANARLTERLAAVQEELAQAQAKVNSDREAHPDLIPATSRAPLPVTQVGPVRLAEDKLEELEFAGVLLLTATLFSVPFMRCFYRCCETRRHRFLPFILIFNVIVLVNTLTYLRLIDFNSLFFGTVKAFEVLLMTVRTFLSGIIAIVGLFVAFKLKDRILAVLGVEHAGMLIGDFRDWATCWSMKRFHPIEIYVLKVEGLPSEYILGDNCVFCVASLGYNMEMRTRVHNGAGHKCIFKETMQLNFDPWDTDSRLRISVKHQGVLCTEISSVQIGAAKIRELEKQAPIEDNRTLVTTSRVDSPAWNVKNFTAFDMVPAGTLYLRFETVPREEVHMSFWECCCGWLSDTSQSGHGSASSHKLLGSQQYNP